MSAFNKAKAIVVRRQTEEGHAYAWGSGGLVTIILVVLLLILIF